RSLKRGSAGASRAQRACATRKNDAGVARTDATRAPECPAQAGLEVAALTHTRVCSHQTGARVATGPCVAIDRVRETSKRSARMAVLGPHERREYPSHTAV